MLYLLFIYYLLFFMETVPCVLYLRFPIKLKDKDWTTKITKLFPN